LEIAPEFKRDKISLHKADFLDEEGFEITGERFISD